MIKRFFILLVALYFAGEIFALFPKEDKEPVIPPNTQLIQELAATSQTNPNIQPLSYRVCSDIYLGKYQTAKIIITTVKRDLSKVRQEELAATAYSALKYYENGKYKDASYINVLLFDSCYTYMPLARAEKETSDTFYSFSCTASKGNEFGPDKQFMDLTSEHGRLAEQGFTEKERDKIIAKEWGMKLEEIKLIGREGFIKFIERDDYLAKVTHVKASSPDRSVHISKSYENKPIDMSNAKLLDMSDEEFIANAMKKTDKEIKKIKYKSIGKNAKSWSIFTEYYVIVSPFFTITYNIFNSTKTMMKKGLIQAKDRITYIVHIPTLDEYGHENMSLAMKLTWTGKTLHKINWENADWYLFFNLLNKAELQEYMYPVLIDFARNNPSQERMVPFLEKVVKNMKKK